MQPHEWTTNDFKGDPGIDYCHDKFLFAHSLHTLPERMIGARMHFGMAIYCRQGTIQITIDGRQYRLEQGQRLSYQEALSSRNASPRAMPIWSSWDSHGSSSGRPKR